MRAPNDAWNVELHVECLAGASAVSGLPLLQLVAADAPESGPLELERYELVASAAHGGAHSGIRLVCHGLAFGSRTQVPPVSAMIGCT